jgi:aspartate aminotransferase
MTLFQTNDSNLREISHSETLLINEAQDNLHKKNQKIYRFGFGQSPFSPPEMAVKTLKDQAYQHDYLPVAGLNSCQEAVAKAHQCLRTAPITADDIVIAPGSKMIIYTVMACYKNATVLLPQPSWVSYAPQAKLLDHNVDLIPTNFDAQWKIQPDTFNDVCKKHPNTTRILVLNYPGNPTGMTYTASELEALAKVAKEHNVLVISDEIYGWLNHNNNHVSIADYYPEGTFITTGLSKWCGAGGWRFGAGIFPSNASKEFKTTYYGIASETYSTTAAPVQYTATEIYNNMDQLQPFIHAQQQILSKLSHIIVQQLQQANVRVHQSQGGFYIFPDFSNYKDALLAKGVDTAEALCVELLNNEGVAMLPASAFGFTPEHLYTRMCYVDFNGTEAIHAFQNGETLDAAFFNKYAPSVINGITALTNYLESL